MVDPENDSPHAPWLVSATCAGIVIFILGLAALVWSHPDTPATAEHEISDSAPLGDAAADSSATTGEWVEQPVEQLGSVFDTANPAKEAYYQYGLDPCYVIYAKNTGELVREIEGEIGRRIGGYQPFPNGIVVNFSDGGRLSLWQREIDCKDPPYDPYERLGAPVTY